MACVTPAAKVCMAAAAAGRLRIGRCLAVRKSDATRVAAASGGVAELGEIGDQLVEWAAVWAEEAAPTAFFRAPMAALASLPVPGQHAHSGAFRPTAGSTRSGSGAGGRRLIAESLIRLRKGDRDLVDHPPGFAPYFATQVTAEEMPIKTSRRSGTPGKSVMVPGASCSTA